MSTMKGWGLTARLISKHFGTLGDMLAQSIARYDPETATRTDRDHLAERLRDTAQKLAAARASFTREQADVVTLRELIANDEKALLTLSEKMASGQISEATVGLFCDELEANTNRLPMEIQEQDDARDYMTQLQLIVDSLSQQLAQFDASAKKAIQGLNSAKAQKDLQEMHLERQSQLTGLAGLQGQSSALSALTRRAEALSAEADGLRIVVDIGQKPLDQAAEIAAIRRSVTQSGNTAESMLERLRRLSAQQKDAAAA
jgi:hypothetical protein